MNRQNYGEIALNIMWDISMSGNFIENYGKCHSRLSRNFNWYHKIVNRNYKVWTKVKELSWNGKSQGMFPGTFPRKYWLEVDSRINLPVASCTIILDWFDDPLPFYQ